MLYVKALHIIFVVTWFAGLFYVVRLFIYHAEANEKPEPARTILSGQLALMAKRLWYGITWPSAIITLALGPAVWLLYGGGTMAGALEVLRTQNWLEIKLLLVAGLYAYHLTLHRIFRQQSVGVFKYSSQQLRVWNEVATLFLVAIVMLVVVKQGMSPVWGLLGLALLVVVLMSAIKIYKLVRK
jgi:protoporphyrinogen IX oxidase